MQVLVYCPWAHSSSYYTAKYCNALASEGAGVSLLAPDNFMGDLLSSEVKRMSWPYLAPERTDLTTALQTPSQAARLLRAVRRMQPDWVHLLWVHPAPCLLTLWLRQRQVAYTAHDPILHDGEAGMARRWVQQEHIRMARLVFVHGEANKQKLVEECTVAPDRVVSIPHGEFMFWERIPAVKQEKLILFFGRIRKYKGINVLLDAFEKAGPRIPDYRLRICGEGELGGLGRRARSVANVEVVNLFVDHAEVPPLFLSSQFLVLPYLDGTQSGVVPMAFALGRTCIVSAVGSIPEVVQHEENGLLVKPGDSDELAEAMVRLAGDEQLRHRLEQAALGSAMSSDSLSWELAARKAVAAYSSNLSTRQESGVQRS